jgi:hypothetical protein
MKRRRCRRPVAWRTRRKQIEESEQGVYLSKKRRDAMEAGRFAEVE